MASYDDTTNSPLFQVLLPLLAAGVSGVFPRHGAPAAALGLQAFDTINRNRQYNRYQDAMGQERQDQARAGGDLQQGLYSAADIPTTRTPSNAGATRGGRPVPDTVTPVPDLPSSGRSYLQATGATPAINSVDLTPDQSPESAARAIVSLSARQPSGDRNAATSADIPPTLLSPDVAKLAASFAAGGDPSGMAAARQLASANIKTSQNPDLARMFALSNLPPGSKVHATTPEGYEVTREGPAYPKEFNPETASEAGLFAYDPKKGTAFMQAKAKAAAQYADHPGDVEVLPGVEEVQRDPQTGQPVLDKNGQTIPTGNMTFGVYDKRSNKQLAPLTMSGVKPRAGGTAPQPKAGKNAGVLANLLTGGGAGQPYVDEKGNQAKAPQGAQNGQTFTGSKGTKLVVKDGLLFLASAPAK